jgi:hypothetical protein
VVGDHVADLAVAGAGELQADADTLQRRVPGADHPDHRERVAQAAELVVVLARLQRDVVAEPLRLLVGVGVAADVEQQRRVVDDRPLLLADAGALGQPQRDQALAQDVLHRLAEAEVDAERERGDELGQPDARTVDPAGHARSVLPENPTVTPT